jgi:hypothetical protein
MATPSIQVLIQFEKKSIVWLDFNVKSHKT